MSDEDKILILLSALLILALTFFFLQPQKHVQEDVDIQEDVEVNSIVVLVNPDEVCEDLCKSRNDDMKSLSTENDLIYCTCLSGYKRLIGA